MNFVLLFQLLAVALGAAAVFFYWRGDSETMFVTGVLGAVSFLLSIRFQIKTRMKQREAEKHKDILS